MESKGDRTKEGMEKARSEGKHVARPAVFMFAEDVATAPEGRCVLEPSEGHRTVTKVIPEDEVMEYARQGYTLNHVAKCIGVSLNVLANEMRPRDPDNPNSRTKGVKDRYSEYMRIYRETRGIE